MSRLLLLVAVAAFTVMSIAHVTASEGEEAEARGSIRGRTLMATADRGRFPECQRNRTRCLDPNLKPDGPTCCSNRLIPRIAVPVVRIATKLVNSASAHTAAFLNSVRLLQQQVASRCPRGESTFERLVLTAMFHLQSFVEMHSLNSVMQFLFD
ncbi:hypothetical protein AXG93_2396s1370 [Marchantia polymorpha subsp. ruderalis]|uniref:Bifunctional inhibitor/plant lipid transfer protein/seed storage helical domain-containing protein n=1 Tax=Marchantia polymorpha subsp. ruderalis TaxID=1480154 RepID=A0A176VFT7_MARPO|nr:hypothetical protein AXG93_2396s1370 [Marchantia polymorpha subsp. ruderalis]